jgi:hypothetical protein
LMDVGLLLFRVRLYSSGQRRFTKRQANFNKDYRSNDLLKENDVTNEILGIIDVNVCM